jgi:hypothetical protein
MGVWHVVGALLSTGAAKASRPKQEIAIERKEQYAILEPELDLVRPESNNSKRL